MEVGQGIDLVAKDKLVLEGAVQAFQDAHATDLGDATADPSADVLTDVLKMARGKIRTGVALDEAGASQSEDCQSLMPLQQGRSGAFLTQRRGRTGRHTVTGFNILDPIHPGDAIVQAKSGGVDLKPSSFGPITLGGHRP